MFPAAVIVRGEDVQEGTGGAKFVARNGASRSREASAPERPSHAVSLRALGHATASKTV